MTQAVQMDFNFEEPLEMGAFVKQLKERKIPEADIYGLTDRVTNHFEELKTTELILEMVRPDVKEELPALPVTMHQKKNNEDQRMLNQRKAERVKQRKAKYPQIFTEGGYLRFQLTVANYTKDDQTPKAKFSNLYHFFKYENLLICTQLEYIDFVEMEYEVHLSKILPTTRKYEENILPLLARISKVRQIE